jgi:hypothetical protein
VACYGDSLTCCGIDPSKTSSLFWRAFTASAIPAQFALDSASEPDRSSCARSRRATASRLPRQPDLACHSGERSDDGGRVPERGGSDQEIEISNRRPCGTEATALAPEHLAGLEINADEREAVLLQLVEAFDDRRVSVGRSRMVMVTSWPSGKSSFSTGSRRPPRTRARIVLMSTPPFFSECECLMVSV